jgi:predicted phosphodiesterase
MARPKEIARLEAEKYCKKFTQTPTLTLAKKIYKENPELFSSIEQARSYVRTVRGKRGEKVRKCTTDKTLYEKEERSRSSFVLPESFADDFTPYKISQSKVLVISDLHFPYQDNNAITLALKYGQEKDVNCILINGDLIDFATISRHEKDFRSRSVFQEFEAVRLFLRSLRDNFPNAKIVFKEGNHCFFDGTEVLTNRGFVDFNDLNSNDLVAQFDNQRNISYASPERIIKQQYVGDVYDIENNYSHQIVTDEHNVVVGSEKKKAKEITNNDIKNIPLSGFSNSSIDISDDYLRLITWIVCDGCIFKDKDKKDSYRLQFKLSKERKIDRLRDLLEKLEIPYTFKECKKTGINKLQPYYIRVYGKYAKELYEYLGGVKRFPYEFTKMSKEQFNVFYNELSITDGYVHDGAVNLITTSKYDADIIQIAAISTGNKCNIATGYNKSGFKNGKVQYRLRINTGNKTHLSINKISSKKEDTIVHCVTMPLGTVITRYNGKVAFSGNCERWEKWLYIKAPEIFDDVEFKLETRLRLGELGIDIVKDKRPVNIGKLTILHGHEMAGGSGGVNPARATFLKTLDSVVVGHYHKTSSHVETTMNGSMISVHSIGALCGLYPQYMRINKWNHGFGYVEHEIKNGEYHFHNLKIYKGKVY